MAAQPVSDGIATEGICARMGGHEIIRSWPRRATFGGFEPPSQSAESGIRLSALIDKSSIRGLGGRERFSPGASSEPYESVATTRHPIH